MKKQIRDESKEQIYIKPIKVGNSSIEVKSTNGSTYIPHRQVPENVRKMVGRELGESKQKSIRNLDTEYEDCFYYTSDKKYGIPAAAFMGSILDACVACDIPKTKIKRAFKIIGDIIPLKYGSVRRRIDTVRRSGMTAAPDIRHRPEFVNWSCVLNVQYDVNQITLDQIVNLVSQAGFSSGVGDWRPSAPKSSGNHGMYMVSKTSR